MDLLPSNIDLSAAEVQLVHEVAREQTLQRVLQPAIAEYDVILIDCQPSLGLLTVNALTASDGVIVPLECEYFALRGVALLKTTIDKVTERLNPKLQIDGVLGTMYDGRTLHGREVMERLVQAWGDTVFHTVIRRTVKFSDSTVAGEPITTYAGTSAGSGRLPAAGEGGGWLVVSTCEPADRRRPLPADGRTRPGRRGRGSPASPADPEAADDGVADEEPARPGQAAPSGRVRHDEKMTVYVTSDELLDLEHARLMLRRNHGLGVDRGRLVRAAVAIWCWPTSSVNGDDSALVQRLPTRPRADPVSTECRHRMLTRAPRTNLRSRERPGARRRPPAPDDGPPAFAVRLENFEGPFDLLLSLIAKHKLDITEVALSKVTDEFIAFIKVGGKEWDLEQTSSFLLVASTLLDLKAARLLPQGDVEDEEDLALLEARDLLFARLLQYRAFKQVAGVARAADGRGGTAAPARGRASRSGSPPCCPRC